jgi:hypothetical protein
LAGHDARLRFIVTEDSMHARGKALALAAVCLAGLAGAAGSLGAVVGERATRIVSPPGGTPPADERSDKTTYSDDGGRSGSRTPTANPVIGGSRPADNLEFSQDNRTVRYAAFDSSAKNLVGGSSANGESHVYLFTRNTGGGTTDELLDGSLEQVDTDGPSMKPSLDGQTRSGNGAVKPHCVVFQSQGRLAKGDSSDDWDVYLYDIGSMKTKLVSAGKTNARDGVVNGECEYVTYEAGGKVYVHWIQKGQSFELANGFNPDQQTDGKGVAYDRNGQVYYQAFEKKSVKYKSGPRKGKHHDVLQKDGGEQLVSDNASGRPGNGDSMMPAVNDNGAYIAFESKATDLCDGSKKRCGMTDKNGARSDVYRRTMPGKKAPTNDEMEMISYDGTIDLQPDQDSDQVKISGAGEQACFRSFGVNARNEKFVNDGQPGPFMHIYFWNFPRERMIGAFSGESRAERLKNTELRRDDGTAAFSWSCAISNRGNFIGFTSDTEHMAGETNGRTLPDMFVRFMGGSDEGLGGDLG